MTTAPSGKMTTDPPRSGEVASPDEPDEEGSLLPATLKPQAARAAKRTTPAAARRSLTLPLSDRSLVRCDMGR